MLIFIITCSWQNHIEDTLTAKSGMILRMRKEKSPTRALQEREEIDNDEIDKEVSNVPTHVVVTES